MDRHGSATAPAIANRWRKESNSKVRAVVDGSPLEPGLLVVVERGVEFVQGGALKRYRVDHGIEPVDHGFETAGRGDTHDRWAGGLKRG